VTGPGGTVFSSPVATTARAARMTITGLAADTAYTCRVVADSDPVRSLDGAFTTLPAAGAASFTVAFSGDTDTGNNHEVFDTIRNADPLMFIHLGDLHYEDIATNSPALFRAAYDRVLSANRQSQLYRNVPTTYVWDDHDSGPNNSHAATVPAAACSVYRERVPHYPLVQSSGPIYHSFVIGRCRFVVTDQRSQASDGTAVDDASKTVLGATQKAWFKSELDAAVAAGQLVVWVCSRTFGGLPATGGDHWGYFTTERTELCDYIQANAPGRVVVLSADRHSLDIDDGTNHDFTTTGSEPIKTFQASPLDRTLNGTYGGATYSEGSFFAAKGQFGTMEVTDSGGATLGVVWRGFNSAGTQLVSYSFTSITL
jgi:phosphodiesterase/alkaline phosphatase D-like protein